MSTLSRPISAPNQHTNIVDQIVGTQQRLFADAKVQPNTNGGYNRQLRNQPMAGQQQIKIKFTQCKLLHNRGGH
jgi:hypothetical protein